MLKKRILNLSKKLDGFTITKKGNFTKRKDGYFVSLSNNSTLEINDRILNRVIKQSEELEAPYIGMWHNEGRYYLDVSIHTKNIDEAFSIAKTFKQKAIFECSTMSELFV